MKAREKIDEIKQLWGLKTDDELAKKLEISKETINSWLKRDKIPEKWELKIGQMNNNITGNHNIVTSGANNVVSTHSGNNPQMTELCRLIEQYATPKLIDEFKEKLLKIKEVVDG